MYITGGKGGTLINLAIRTDGIMIKYNRVITSHEIPFLRIIQMC